jgi:hypothetical protein
MIGAKTQLRVAADVLHRKVGDDTVLIHLERGDYFSLDEVGGRALELLAERASLAAVHGKLVGEYAVDPEQPERDLEELFGELLDAGLIEVAG